MAPYCQKSTDRSFDYLWFSMHNFQPYYDECWAENAKLHYNPTTRRSYSDQGVSVEPRDFGNTSGIEFVSPESQQSPQSE